MSKFVPARASLAALAFALAIPFQAQAAETDADVVQADSTAQADAAAQSAGEAARDAAAATRAAGEAAAQAIAGEATDPAAPAFVDTEKMRDVIESSRSMSAETKAEILQLLDAAALDPTKLDAALAKYRAALQ